jgi:exo-beta-1,3-glucanase (GH17 family)
MSGRAPGDGPSGWTAYGLALLAGLALVALGWAALGRPVVLEEVLAPGGRLQCVSYTPFTRDQSPLRPPFTITREQVARDFALLARSFDCVRTYSVTGLEVIPELAREHGLKVLLGAWIGVDKAVNAREVEGVVALANRHPEVVTGVIVGNEVLLRREMTGAQVAELVRAVKARVPQPVTYADVWEFWRKHPEVAPAVDFVTIHLLPYWEDDPSGIDAALEEVRRVREVMGRTFPDRPILIGETGWPSEGRQREDAVPSRVNQARFVRGFVRMAEAEGWRYNLIEAFDQPWKRDKEGAVGGYWGLFDTGRSDKGVLAGPVTSLPGWPAWLALSLGLAGAVLLVAGVPRSRYRGAGVPLLALAGGALVAYHLRYAAIAARGWAEWAWMGAEAALALGVTLWLALRASAPAGGWRVRLAGTLDRAGGRLALAIGFGASVLALQLAFEPRYRDFPFWVYLLPALGLLALAARGALPRRADLPLLGVLLLLAAPAIVVQETVTNGPALAWVAVSLALAAAYLWPAPGRQAPGG